MGIANAADKRNPASTDEDGNCGVGGSSAIRTAAMAMQTVQSNRPPSTRGRDDWTS
jgi:hypothetical protein